jgi:hypothetical protein
MTVSPLHQPIRLGGTDFKPIDINDAVRVSEAVESSKSWLWAAYVPFLLAYSDSPARAVLLGEIGRALAVLLRRKIRGADHLDFFLPPLGDDPGAAWQSLLPHVVDINGATETRLLWGDLGTAALALQRGWRVAPYEKEYLYRREAVLAMNGMDFRALRKRLHRCEREVQPEIIPFEPSHIVAGAQLLREWQDAREEQMQPIFDFGYTMSALQLSAAIMPPHLVGILAIVDGIVRAFAFGGMLRDGVGQFFLLKSDPAAHGLAETMRVALIERLEDCELVNDAGDLGKPGLAQHKNLFSPTAFVPTFKISLNA